MADEDGDLVSNVKVEGVDQSTTEIKKFGDEGAAAFDKVNEAAKKAGDSAASAGEKISGGLKDAAPPPEVEARINDITNSIGRLKNSVANSIGHLVHFAEKIEAIGVAGLAGIVGVAKFASATTKAFREIGETTKESIRTQQDLGRAQTEGVRQSNDYNASVTKLNEQVRLGKINWQDYGKSLTDLNKEFDAHRAAQERVAAAESEARKKNDAAILARQQQKALDDLIKTYGGPLTSSLIALGTTYDKIHEQVVNAFSPALASLVDAIAGIIDRNRAAITNFINDSSKALEDFIKNNGPEIEAFFSLMADIIKGVGTIIISIVIPAFTALKAIAQFIADKINDIFGTKLTAGIVIAAAALLLLTGAFSALWSVIGTVIFVVLAVGTALGGFGTLIALLIVALIAFAATVNWTKLGADIKAAFEEVVTFFTELPGKITAFFTKLWEDSKKLAIDAATAIVEGWNQFLQFFADLPGKILIAIDQLWTDVKSKTSELFAALKIIVTNWATSVVPGLDFILDKIRAVRDYLNSAPTGSDSTGNATASFAEGGPVRGAGTSISDSILAFLSNNEFVMRAKAVAKYGLGFMQAINSGQLDIGRILGHAAGGVIQSMQGNQTPRLAYASGGSVNARATHVLNLTVGNEQFNGLLMPDDVADKMTKFAVGKQSVSTGRRASWVGGRR